MQGGTVISRARHRAALTQSVLASRLGTTKSAISRWENGQVEPAFSAVVGAVEACCLSLSSVVAEPEPDPHDLGLLESAQQLSLSERLQRVIDMVTFIESGRRHRGVPAR